MNKKRLRSYLLDDETLDVLLKVAKHSEVSMGEIVRSAIRYYSVRGPWTALTGQRRREILGDLAENPIVDSRGKDDGR